MPRLSKIFLSDCHYINLKDKTNKLLNEIKQVNQSSEEIKSELANKINQHFILLSKKQVRLRLKKARIESSCFCSCLKNYRTTRIDAKQQKIATLMQELGVIYFQQKNKSSACAGDIIPEPQVITAETRITIPEPSISYNAEMQKQENIKITAHEKLLFKKMESIQESDLLYNSLVNSLVRNGRRWSADDAAKEIKNSNHYAIKPLSEKEHLILAHSHSYTEVPCHINNNIKKNLIGVSTNFGGSFDNYYSPSFWLLSYNFKNNNSQQIYLSEVVRAQYEKAAKRGKFHGQLPSVIVRRGIIKGGNKIFLRKYQDRLSFGHSFNQQEIINEFFKIPGNGASTKRICDAFGLEAVGISLNKYSIYVHVVPRIEQLK